MKEIKRILLITIIVTLTSCGGNSKSQPATARGFSEIEKVIKSKFGDDAYFTDLTITYNKSIGNIVSLTVTDSPESLKMGQWNQTQNTWKQNSDITVEVPKGSKAADFMFQLNEKINLSKLGELVETSIKKLKEEKKLKDPRLEMAFIKFPKSGDIAKTEYTILLKPENGGTTFTFRYKINGDFLAMNN